jgi:hypothetical protein
MKSLPLDGLETWLQSDEAGEVFLYQPTLHTSEPPVHWGDGRERAYALVVTAFARMVLWLGLAPTFPAWFGSDWREALGLHSLLVAVWNYDYYQLSLRVTERGRDDCMVVAARHRPV